ARSAERTEKFRGLFLKPGRCRKQIWYTKCHCSWAWARFVCWNAHRDFSRDWIANFIGGASDWFSIDLRNRKRGSRLLRNWRCAPEIVFLRADHWKRTDGRARVV